MVEFQSLKLHLEGPRLAFCPSVLPSFQQTDVLLIPTTPLHGLQEAEFDQWFLRCALQLPKTGNKDNILDQGKRTALEIFRFFSSSRLLSENTIEVILLFGVLGMCEGVISKAF